MAFCSDRSYERAYTKFEVRSFSFLIWQSIDTPRLPFLPIFSLAFVRMDPVNVWAKFTFRSFTHS